MGRALGVRATRDVGTRLAHLRGYAFAVYPADHYLLELVDAALEASGHLSRVKHLHGLVLEGVEDERSVAGDGDEDASSTKESV